jgi:hypothetical protein
MRVRKQRMAQKEFRNRELHLHQIIKDLEKFNLQLEKRKLSESR